jgi:prophage regulatory protein
MAGYLARLSFVTVMDLLSSQPGGETPTQPPTIRILRIEAVIQLIGLRRTMIYNLGDPTSKYFDPTFPSRFKIHPKGSAVGWYEHELLEWLRARK